MVFRYCRPFVEFKLSKLGWSTWMCSSASIERKAVNQFVIPTPNDGITCSTVISPGIREILFTPATISNPPFGSVSPVPRVKSPGVPSKAGMGTHLRCWDTSSSAEALDATGSGVDAGGVAPASGAALASVDAASFLEFGSLADDAGVAPFLSFGLLSSAKLAVEISKSADKDRIAARAPNFISPPHIGCVAF